MTANVQSVDSIREFRVQLLVFKEELASVLQTMLSELQRGAEWIEQDVPGYWNHRLRFAFDQVASTRQALTSCELRTVAGRRGSCIEEKVAFDKAKRRVQHCQDLLHKSKGWAARIQHDSNEFRGRLASLQRLVEVDIPKAIALLERTVQILDEYTGKQ